MLESIRDTLRNKNIYEAEKQYIVDYISKETLPLTNDQTKRLIFLEGKLLSISTWLTLLSEDEAYVIKRHLVDGIDIPRIALEYRERWGEEFAKTERTIKTYQRRALDKIQDFEIHKKHLFE